FEPELYRMRTLDPAHVIGEREARFAGIEARIVCGDSQVARAVDGQTGSSETRVQEIVAGRIVQAILEPTEARLIHSRWRKDRRALHAPVAIADRGIGVVPDGVSGVEHDAGSLDAVRRNPAQHAQTEAQAVAVVELVIDFTEAEILPDSARNRSK